MTDRIEIEFRPSEGAILRLIGLVERRGFEVRGVDMPETEADAPMRMGLQIKARDEGRKMPILCAQLAKVYGVRAVYAGGAQHAPYEVAS